MQAHTWTYRNAIQAIPLAREFVPTIPYASTVGNTPAETTAQKVLLKALSFILCR